MPSSNHEPPLTLLYVTFDLGDNVGGIIDYLVASFENVYYLSLRTHDNPARPYNMLMTWQNGEQVTVRRLPTISAPYLLQQFLVPLIYLLNAIELLYATYHAHRHGRVMLFTPNPIYTAVGLLLRPFFPDLRIILWVGDIIIHNSRDVRVSPLYRQVVNRFAPWVFRNADAVWYMTDFLHQISAERLLPSQKPDWEIVAPLAIGEHPHLDTTQRDIPRVGFMGNLAPHKGGAMLVDIVSRLLQARPDIQIEVIGAGPCLDDLRRIQQTGEHVIKLHGTVSDQTQLTNIMNRWQVALAPYPPPSPGEYFGGLSKVQTYLSLHLPTVLTRLPWLPEEIHEAGAGVAVDFEVDAFVQGTLTVLNDPVAFRQRAARFAEHYSPGQLYDPVFEALICHCYPDQE